MEYQAKAVPFLGVLFCCLYGISSVGQQLTFDVYSRDSDVDNYDCPDSDIIVTSANSKSLADCARLCSSTDNCTSFFYTEVTWTCHGCSEVYTASQSSGLSTSNGSVYFTTGQSNATAVQSQPSVSYEYTFETSGYNMTSSDTFDNCVTECGTMGGRPVVIEKQEENDFIKTFITALSIDSAWIGCVENGGNWSWYDTGDSLVYKNWYPVEPNGLGLEQCGMMFHLYGYQWADFDCTVDYIPMVCEFPQ